MQTETTMPQAHAADATMSTMDVKARIHSIKPEGSVRARCSLELGGCFAVRGVKLMDGPNGYFLSMPSYKVADGYKDLCFPVNKAFRQAMLDTVVGEYEQTISQAAGHWQVHTQEEAAQEATQRPAPFEEAAKEAYQTGLDAGQQMAGM